MKYLLVLFVVFLLGNFSLIADENISTIEGKLVCIGCTLKKSDGAKAQCSIYGHKHGLKSNTGAIYNFIENDKSKDVINSEKYHNKSVKITGKVHHAANMISLETIEEAK